MPHNEPWSSVPRLTYWALLSVFCMGSYLPYTVVLRLLHGAVAYLLFLHIRHLASSAVALMCATREHAAQTMPPAGSRA